MSDENGAEVNAEETSQVTETTDNMEYIEDPILDQEEMKKMFVGGITTTSKDEELKEFFEKVSGGSVTDYVVIRKETDKKSHFGFVTFESSHLVDEVLLKRDELNFNGRLLDVNRAVPKNNTSPGAHEKTKKLFIANLPKQPQDCNEDELRKYFEARHPKKYGTIESIQLIKKKDEAGNKLEENKGYGFVMVSSEDLADKMAIQHATFEFGGRRIELKKSVPTTESRGGGRGRGRGRGGNQSGYGSGGAPYGTGYGAGYGAGGWGADYGAGYGAGYGGYGAASPYDYYGGYGGGYGQAPGGRGGRGGRGRYAPY